MPDCNFLYHTGTSKEIIRMLHHRELDLGIVTAPLKATNDLIDWPLLRDPFVIVLPVSTDSLLQDIFEGRTKLPFLQFSSDLIIAGQIEAQLRRLGVQLPNKFECGNNQTLMAMVAAGAGWTITTPLLFSRARRFHKKLRMHPFPGKSFGRTLSLIASPDCAQSVIDLVIYKVRSELNRQVIADTHRTIPWLKDQFVLID
jgi:DNA-binding transcriptional LysR family regulator